MLLVESDRAEPAASAELDEAVRACEAAGATSTMRAADADRGRLAPPGPPPRAPRPRAPGPGPDGGRRRAPQPRAGPAPGDFQAIGEKYDIRIATFGHAGDGNLHPNFIFDHDDPRAEELTDLGAGATCTAPRSRWAAPSPRSTGSGSPGGTRSSSRSGPTSSASCARSRRPSTRRGSSTPAASSSRRTGRRRAPAQPRFIRTVRSCAQPAERPVGKSRHPLDEPIGRPWRTQGTRGAHRPQIHERIPSHAQEVHAHDRGRRARRPDGRRGAVPRERRRPPRRAGARWDRRRRPDRAPLGARRPRHQRPVRLQGARRRQPHRDRAHRQPRDQPVRRQLRRQRPLRHQHRHERRPRRRPRLRRAVRRPPTPTATRSGSSAATPAATPRRSTAARPSPRARRTAPRSRSARTASGPGPASGPTRSSST